MRSRKYLLYGAIFGLLFPLAGTVIEAAIGSGGLSLEGELAAQSRPLLWFVWTAPLFFSGLANLGGGQQDQLVQAEAGKRIEFLDTAKTLVAAAQSLLSSASAFSSLTAETVASVRETTPPWARWARPQPRRRSPPRP